MGYRPDASTTKTVLSHKKKRGQKSITGTLLEVSQNLEGFEADLEAALDLMVRVASKKQTTDEMGRWVSLNYPQYRKRLPKELRELPPQRAKTKKVMRAKK
jgi:hypothetical protein